MSSPRESVQQSVQPQPGLPRPVLSPPPPSAQVLVPTPQVTPPSVPTLAPTSRLAPDGSWTRVRLDLAYDGTEFAGWATQPGLRTVQQVVEEALAQVLRLPSPPRLTVAGRTDAGVHARGQVAHVDLPTAAFHSAPGRSTRTPAAALARAVNAVLRHDVVVHEVREVSPDFDARFSALWRLYEYTLVPAGAVRDPLLRGWQWWLKHPVEVAAMNRAAAALVGERDFATFCKRREGATTIRTLQEFSFSADAAGVLTATVRADAFCRSMVRALIGWAVDVGRGKRDLAAAQALADQVTRTKAVTVAPARGLALVEVGYPDPSAFAARARLARARRVSDASAPDLSQTPDLSPDS